MQIISMINLNINGSDLLLIGKYLNLEDYISLQEDRVFNDTVYPCDYSDIKSELGWSFTRSLEDELPAVIEWYRDRIDQYKLFL